ncbi:hypothetical protein L1049_000330 [Liquidambar formosana]|uniref:Uncharacterized protein n=1 Tax=Liquidambar formosana TaxID=63359 RepID=A0AAP0R7M5_LIQFO
MTSKTEETASLSSFTRQRFPGVGTVIAMLLRSQTSMTKLLERIVNQKNKEKFGRRRRVVVEKMKIGCMEAQSMKNRGKYWRSRSISKIMNRVLLFFGF